MGSTTLIVFESVTFCVLCLTAYHMGHRAISSKTGPTSRKGLRVKNYSGMQEGDVVAVFINLLMSVAYLGGLMETVTDEHHGLFHTYKYLPYLFTCPMIMWDLIYSTGGLYRNPIAALTWVDLLIALLSDMAPYPVNWGWFGFGAVVYVVLIYFLLSIAKRAWNICTSLSERSKFYHDNEEGGVASGYWTPGGHSQISSATGSPSRRRAKSWDREEDEEESYRKMKKARIYICVAIALMFVVWPMFPIVWILEKTDVISLETTIKFFCCLDVFAKSFHTLMVEKYREIMLDRLSRYGFLSPDILRRIDDTTDVAEQLRQLALSRDMKQANKTLAWVGGVTRKTVAPLSDMPARKTIVPLSEMAKVTRRSLQNLAEDPAVTAEKLRRSVLEVAESLRPMERQNESFPRPTKNHDLAHERAWEEFNGNDNHLSQLPGVVLQHDSGAWSRSDDGNEAQYHVSTIVATGTNRVRPMRAPSPTPNSTMFMEI